MALEAGSPRIKADLVPGGNPPPGLLMAVFLACPHMVGQGAVVERKDRSAQALCLFS